MHTASRLRTGRAAATLATLVLAAGLSGPVLARDNLQPGKPAPDFTATDSAGKPVTLSSLKGKTVVLEWSNDGCPYVGKHYNSGTMQKLQADATADGAVWLTVISSAPGTQGHVNGLEADKLTADRGAKPTAVLLDPKGALGKLYGASTTPHMYVIDAGGMLRYMGGIDDKPSASPASLTGAKPYVREALAAIAAGKPVDPASTRPYGCAVKYAD
ncbi:MAG: redoxin domain-containing protein [Hyphomicrobiaceae bacterium]|nr:redoxin domain-containing protein [Hyphomicrobiaceae bacterium]